MRWQSLMIELGQTAPELNLNDGATGRRIRLENVRGPHGLLILFICNHCHFVQHIIEDLVDFAREYSKRGIGTVAVSSNDVEAHPEDGPEQMAQFAKRHAMPFPYLYDESQAVAKAYGAACTPDLFLYDGAGRLYYRGQFDDSRPSTPHTAPAFVAVRGGDLRAAADGLLRGEAPPEKQKPSMGCSMKWKPGNAPDWA